MSKYQVLDTLWSPSGNRYIKPGEVIELGDDIARILLDKKVVKPAVFVPTSEDTLLASKRTGRKSRSKKVQE